MMPLNSVVRNQQGILIMDWSITHPIYTSNVLCEDGTNCLTEDGGLVLTEPNNYVLINLLLEDGMIYLLEDGFSTYLLEDNPVTLYMLKLEDDSYYRYESLEYIFLEDLT